MIRALEAVASLVKPAAMQVLHAYERLESGVAYNPVSEEAARDPYAVYRRIRDKDPVHRMRLVDAWVLTRYDDADAMLRDHTRFSNEDRRFHDTGLTALLDIDPPDHTRLRALVFRAFTPRSVRNWHGRVQVIADRLHGRGRRPGSLRPDLSPGLPATGSGDDHHAKLGARLRYAPPGAQLGRETSNALTFEPNQSTEADRDSPPII